MQNVMAIIGMLLLIVVPMVFDDWHARAMFVACGYCRCYGHGKSFNRAKKHYKTNWAWWQRMMWLPIIKEQYEAKYRTMVCLSYVHFLLTFVVVCWFLLSEFVFKEIKFWHYAFATAVVFFIVRFIYDSSVGRSNKRKV